ncbi:hypothetical protein LOK49_LG01G02101 [Camellia lanceoleosa]|uniref:Uncharacterized protein n=1 Tax=Camellia lanceoleosa TaxID=1840588 RepID=A0ACC0IT77_9ERIC|nr:hypothetical protein LOK49_LG01G02101 [Camellia lanceoleosa]
MISRIEPQWEELRSTSPTPEDAIEVFVDGYKNPKGDDRSTGLRGRRRRHSQILLPQPPLHCRKPPYVPFEVEKSPKPVASCAMPALPAKDSEAAMVNARSRKTVRETQAKVGYIGPPTDLSYDHQHLGMRPQTLIEFAEERHPFCSVLLNAKKPAIIVGAGIFERKDKDAIFCAVETIAKHGNIVRPDWNGLNVLLLNAAQAAALDLGLVPESENSIETAKLLYLMGADDVTLEKLPKHAFVVYQCHHHRGVYHANVIFPASAFTEGCAQQTLPAVPTVGDARDDWKIIRALSEVAGVRLPYDSFGAIRSRIRNVAPNLLQIDERQPATFSALLKPEFGHKMNSTPFEGAVENLYMTNEITRASKVMAQCSAMLLKK